MYKLQLRQPLRTDTGKLYYKLHEPKVSARSREQAYRIAESIARKNNWAVSGQPVKVN